jgi:hypothetical protein
MPSTFRPKGKAKKIRDNLLGNIKIKEKKKA